MATYRVPVLRDFSWQPPVEDKDLNQPAGGESKGDRFIVATGAGDWTGEDGHIATANQDNPAAAGHWIFDTPLEGWTVWVKDENCYYHYTGAAWDKDDVDAMASDIASIETIASDTLESLHAYESALSNATSAVKESLLSDLASAISDIDSAIAAETASLATAISTVDDRVDSVETRMLSVTSDMTASINTMVDSAISDINVMVDSAISDVVATISGVSNLAESNQDSINLLYSSLHAYESALSNETSAVSAAAHDEFQTNSNLISNISNTLSAVSNAVGTGNLSAVSNLAQSNYDSINKLYSSLHAYESALSNATSAVKESLLSDLASAISDIDSAIAAETASLATAISTVDDRVDSVETRMLSVTSDMTASINTMVDSAISSLDATKQDVGSYIAAYGAIEFTI